MEMVRTQAWRESLGDEKKQCGRVVQPPNLKFGGREFKSRSND